VACKLYHSVAASIGYNKTLAVLLPDIFLAGCGIDTSFRAARLICTLRLAASTRLSLCACLLALPLLAFGSYRLLHLIAREQGRAFPLPGRMAFSGSGALAPDPPPRP
jgi:hypothetical protein